MTFSRDVISILQPTSPIDLDDYTDMLIVEPHMCDSKWSAQSTALLFDPPHRAALHAWQRRAHRLFQSAFDPERLLQKAGVWGDDKV